MASRVPTQVFNNYRVTGPREAGYIRNSKFCLIINNLVATRRDKSPGGTDTD